MTDIERIEMLFDLVGQMERRLDAVEKKIFVGDVLFRVLSWLFGLGVGLASVFFGVGGK